MRYDLGSEATLGVLLLLSSFLHIVWHYPALEYCRTCHFQSDWEGPGSLGLPPSQPLSFPGYLSCPQSLLQPVAGVTAETAPGVGSDPSAPMPGQADESGWRLELCWVPLGVNSAVLLGQAARTACEFGTIWSPEILS